MNMHSNFKIKKIVQSVTTSNNVCIKMKKLFSKKKYKKPRK